MAPAVVFLCRHKTLRTGCLQASLDDCSFALAQADSVLPADQLGGRRLKMNHRVQMIARVLSPIGPLGHVDVALGSLTMICPEGNVKRWERDEKQNEFENKRETRHYTWCNARAAVFPVSPQGLNKQNKNKQRTRKTKSQKKKHGTYWLYIYIHPVYTIVLIYIYICMYVL